MRSCESDGDVPGGGTPFCELNKALIRAVDGRRPLPLASLCIKRGEPATVPQH